jgi:hypothetical protein
MRLGRLITESSFDIEISEDKSTNDLYVVGIFSSAELKNQNGRIYKRSTLEREVDKLSEQMKRRNLFGELNHPPQADVNLERAAILVENLQWRGNDLYGKAKVLTNLPMGKIAKSLLDEGCSIGISSRGLGTVNEDGYVNEDDYKLITWDLVGSPSNNPSWLKGMYMAEEFNLAYSTKDEEAKAKLEEDLVKIKNARKEYGRHILETIEKIGRNL